MSFPGSCECPIPGSVQGQTGWGPELPDLALDLVVCNPAYGKSLELDVVKVSSNTSLWFYDCTILSDHNFTYICIWKTPKRSVLIFKELYLESLGNNLLRIRI